MGPWVVYGIQGVCIRAPPLRAHSKGPCSYPKTWNPTNPLSKPSKDLVEPNKPYKDLKTSALAPVWAWIQGFRGLGVVWGGWGCLGVFRGVQGCFGVFRGV